MDTFYDSETFHNTLKAQKANWEAFIQNNVISPDVHPMIAQSWIRSKSAGVDPFHLSVIQLSDTELDALYEKNRIFLQYARPLMEELAKIDSEHISLMSLHDSEGYMLALKDPQNLETGWWDDCFRPGVRWREDDIGTNALGLALIEKKPIQTLGPEHYCNAQQNFCCCAAPVFYPDGSIAGVLNITATVNNFSQHMMTLVTLSSYAISNQLKAYHDFEIDHTVLDAISESVIVLDKHMNIIRCSDYAARLFHTTASALLGYHILDVIHIPELGARLRKSEGKSFYCKECSSHFNAMHFVCDVTVTPINMDGRNLGVALTIKNNQLNPRDISSAIGNFSKFTFADILTEDETLLNAIERMKDSSDSDKPILLVGEDGIDKEIFAHAIHSYSRRRGQPFVFADCAAFSPELPKSELFGYSEKGNLIGKLELSDGGTIVLHRIDRLPLEIQNEILRFLISRQIYKYDIKRNTTVDVRVIATADADLSEAVQKHFFSEELYELFSGAIFEIPPLRSRPKDIPVLAQRIVRRMNAVEGTARQLSPELLEQLRMQPLPGNDSELQDIVTRAFYNCHDQFILPEHLDFRKSGFLFSSEAPEKQNGHSDGAGQNSERQQLIESLKSAGFDVERAASELNISRATMYRRMKKYNIKCKDIR